MSDDISISNLEIQDFPFDESENSKKAGDASRSTQNVSQDKVDAGIDYGLDEVNDRNKTLTNLLNEFFTDYKNSQDTIKERSEMFYKLALFILVGVICVNIGLVFIATFGDIESVAGVIALYVYSALTSATSIMTIPIIIAKHLFPTDRDARIIEILKSVITNDCQIREIIYKDKHKDK